MTLTVGFVEAAATSAFDARNMEAARLVRNADGTPRTGVLYCPRADGQVGIPTNGMAVRIPDQESFALQRATGDGATIVVNNGAYDVPIDQAPNANSRIDIIYAKHNDSKKGDPNDMPVFGVAKGDPNAQPVDPAVPAGAEPLLRVTIPAGATSTSASGAVVGSINRFTAMQGGPIRYRSLTTLQNDAGKFANGTTGLYDVGTAANQLFVMVNSRWVRLDADTFVVVQQTNPTNINSGTTPNTLGGTNPSYESSDPTIFPVRTDGVIGPLPFDAWLEVTGNVRYGSGGSANTDRYIELTINDTSVTPVAADQKTASDAVSLSVSSYLRVPAGGYVKLKGYQASGSPRNYQSRLTARLARING